MLILTRNAGEAIIINDNIEVRIMTMANNQVKIGIDAPKDVTIDREEIFLRKKKEDSSYGRQKG